MAVVTGKPGYWRLTRSRKGNRSGVIDVLEEMLPEIGLKNGLNATFSVLGYGNVGSWSGRLAQDRGGDP